jgi:hypothetical protein
MRSNLKWLYILSCLIVLVGVASATTKTTVSPAVLNDPNEPGSVLVFPKYEKGTFLGPDLAVQIPQSEFEISVVCPNGSVCPDNTDVDIKLHWVCDDFWPQCQETDFTLTTTVNGTLRFDPQGNCSPKNDAGNFFETCGSIAPPPCDDGYLIAWVVDETGTAIKFDGLIGDAVLREDSSQVTAYNAIAIQAGAKLATGASTDLYHNGHLNFNGQAYKELTDTIIGSVHYDGPDPVTGINNETELVLLTLDTKSNLPNNPVEVNLMFYNEIEQGQSNNTQFFCTEEFFLQDIGETIATVNGVKGLVTGKAQKTAILGVSDHTGPVTLLGLVITHEDTFSREYAYLLSDDSIPLATAFAP